MNKLKMILCSGNSSVMYEPYYFFKKISLRSSFLLLKGSSISLKLVFLPQSINLMSFTYRFMRHNLCPRQKTKGWWTNTTKAIIFAAVCLNRNALSFKTSISWFFIYYNKFLSRDVRNKMCPSIVIYNDKSMYFLLTLDISEFLSFSD